MYKLREKRTFTLAWKLDNPMTKIPGLGHSHETYDGFSGYLTLPQHAVKEQQQTSHKYKIEHHQIRQEKKIY